MRHTSKAVLLLLSAASAADVNPDFKAKFAQLAATTIKNQGKWQGYLGKPVYNHIGAVGETTAATIMVKVTDDAKANTTNGTFSCIACIKGFITGGTNRTVWCSAAWNYEYTALKLDKSYPMTKENGPLTWATKSTDTGDSAYAGGDQGTCCYSSDKWLAFQALLENATTANAIKTSLFNKWTCPAKFTNSWTADKTPATNNVALSAKNWWCSDGSYNMKDDTAYHTKGAAYSGSS